MAITVELMSDGESIYVDGGTYRQDGALVAEAVGKIQTHAAQGHWDELDEWACVQVITHADTCPDTHECTRDQGCKATRTVDALV